MRHMGRILLISLLLALLSGCSLLSYEDLYTLPRAAEDYYELQNALAQILNAGYSYLSPTAGLHREPIQLTDLDGDETDEAVAFFKTADGEVVIYIFSKNGDVYSPAAVIQGVGSSVAQVEYIDLNGTGSLELIVTYQVSESVTQALQIYRYTGEDAVSLLSTGCTEYLTGDLTGDGCQEILCLTDSGSETVAECFGWTEDILGSMGQQRLSFSYDNLRSLQQGSITEDTCAVLLSGLSPEGVLLTDVLVLQDAALTLLSPASDILSSAASYYAYPSDINGDGLLEVAQARQLEAYDSGSTAQWVTDWYQLSLSGDCERVLTTYQSSGESWYMELPDAWDGQITIKAGDASTSVSYVSLYRYTESDGTQEILTIYTLQGDSRQSLVEENDLIILISDSDTLYAVSLAESDPWEGTITLAQLSELFHYTGNGE